MIKMKSHWYPAVTGYFANPTSLRQGNPKMHAVMCGRSICKTPVRRFAELRISAHLLIEEYIDCKRCREKLGYPEL